MVAGKILARPKPIFSGEERGFCKCVNTKETLWRLSYVTLVGRLAAFSRRNDDFTIEANLYAVVIAGASALTHECRHNEGRKMRWRFAWVNEIRKV